MNERLYFNGINGATGDYDLPPMSPEQLASVIEGESLDEGLLNELQRRREAHLRIMEGESPLDLAQAGWGVVFAAGDERVPAIKEALGELLSLRREQAGERYRELEYRPGESKNKFLVRYGAGPGAVDPSVVPYYLLIVGDPEAIPYRFQSQLDVQYAVGRIHFDTPEEYARYARSVVAAETGGLALRRRAVFFGVRTPGDQATLLSADHLVKPLAEWAAVERPDWEVQPVLADEATKARLGEVLGGAEPPALLFTAGHGMGFPNGDPRQLPHQGALLCQDWPGPGRHRGPIPEEFYFSADDVADDAHLPQGMAFFFACYGAGTPKMDEFSRRAFRGRRREIAPRPFLARLPRRLLAHPRGGMLAVIGHVERAWGYSFMWEGGQEQLSTFKSTLLRLLQGEPVGYAMEYFNDRYAEIATDLNVLLEALDWGEPVDERELVGKWTANNDARAYIIVGDPAARLPLGGERV